MQSPILPPRAGRSGGSLSPAGQTPSPNRLQAATPPGRVNPARTPSRLEQLPRRFKGTGQGARVRTLPTHSASRPRRTRRAARSHSYKSALSPRRLAARFASPQKARVGTAATSQRPDEPGRWHLASPAAPLAAPPPRTPALERLALPPPSPSPGCGLPAKVSAYPSLPPAQCSGTPEGTGEKGERGAPPRPLLAATHLALKVGQTERGAKEPAEVRDGRDFPPGGQLAQPGRAAFLRTHLPGRR